jgi:hypothetical protein
MVRLIERNFKNEALAIILDSGGGGGGGNDDDDDDDDECAAPAVADGVNTNNANANDRRSHFLPRLHNRLSILKYPPVPRRNSRRNTPSPLPLLSSCCCPAHLHPTLSSATVLAAIVAQFYPHPLRPMPFPESKQVSYFFSRLHST